MSSYVDSIATSEEKFRKDGWDGAYTRVAATLTAGSSSVDVFDCKPKSGDTSFYHQEEVTKTAIVLHYTAGQLLGDIPTLTKKDYDVCVAFVLARDGNLYRLFDEKYWSYHLGPACVGGNTTNSKRTVAIEISNLGWLAEDGQKLRTYNGATYCTKDETSLYRTLAAPWRGQRFWASFTAAQYTSLKKLLRYLCAKFSIPFKFVSAAGDVATAPRYQLFASDAEAKAWKGIAAHSNFRSDKWDIGPGFEWSKLEEDAATALCLPVDLGQGFHGTSTALDGYYKHTEVGIKAGYYPLGVNTVWHGGLHVHGAERAVVRATAPGRVVAARLPDDPAKAIGHFGSHNFVLMRHTVAVADAKKHFYSLYMHLRHEPLTKGSETLKGIPWLQKPKSLSKDRYRVKIKDLNFRDAPKGTILGPLVLDEVLQVIDAKTSAPWWKAKRAGGTQGYVYYNADWLAPAEEAGGGLDTDLLAKLQKGGIVAVDRTVDAGDPLWTIGVYGSPGSQVSLLHWEIFAEENLFADAKRYPGWATAEDTNEDFNVDNKQILGLVDQDHGFFESDDILTMDELNRFYGSQNKNVKALRRYAVRFVSEWGVDLDKAIDSMKGRFIKWGLKDRMEPYLFWNDAASAGVPLPKKAVVWHYNPISFVETLLDPVVSDEADPPPPEETPAAAQTPGDGETCTCGSTKNSLFVAIKATPTVTKDMYGAIKKYWIATYGPTNPTYLHEDVAMVLMGHMAGEVGWDSPSMKNYNVGNHKKSAGKTFTAFATWEEYKTEVVANNQLNCTKHTEAMGLRDSGKYGVRFRPPHVQTHFAAFASLFDGVKAHVDLLKGHYTGAFDALQNHAKGTADSADGDDRKERVKALAREYARSLKGYATAGGYEDYIVAVALTAYSKLKDTP